MKRPLLILVFIVMILSGCSWMISDPNTVGSADASQITVPTEPNEITETRDTSLTRIYRFHIIDPDSELAENGLYVIGITGEEKLLVNLGQNYLCKFIEDDYLYCVGAYLVRYDLTTENPEEVIDKVQILPSDSLVIQLYIHDDKWLYLSARMWNKETNIHDEAKCYAVKQDGTEYHEVNWEDIPR